MGQELLYVVGIFIVGALFGVALMLLINKLRSGSVSPSKVREEYQRYQQDVELHFEETSKKFKDMTDQYQDLYRHLSLGATSLCRPDSVAVALADESDPMRKMPKLDPAEQVAETENLAAVEPEASTVDEATVDEAAIAQKEKATAQGKASET
ncbi:MAG: uncharacterized membrane-anchored protein YhcB (DUF1043 family) [Cryomorphaceae bacterium]|jgi:uncharacterized membrane-anchored protein YhcB (DUF1043 family)